MFVEAQSYLFHSFYLKIEILEMPVIEDITEEEENQPTEVPEDLPNLQDRPPEGSSVREGENKFPIEDEGGVESDSEDFFDASDLTTVQQWQFISVCA